MGLFFNSSPLVQRSVPCKFKNLPFNLNILISSQDLDSPVAFSGCRALFQSHEIVEGL